ncbi:6812_t:CDS:2 [Gigaspora margarita]|uniref:6812_t:CDS:1 n=1 Tax=Gigaspora margarita TaxID=4874 RepID=A0ABM8VWG9_GIGMA|nr:6812_t:CDS:2 [Gigaspora margarita]
MKYINNSNLRIDMISDCRLRVIVDLKRFPKLVGSQHFKALCNGVINDPSLRANEKAYLISDLSEINDTQNIIEKVEIRRRCVYCNTDVIATNYCEYCIPHRCYSTIYTAKWENGPFTWDKEQQKLKRGGPGIYILKALENSDKCHSEIKASFTSEQFYSQTHVKCYGLTREPETQKFMLVLQKMDSDLSNFLKETPDLSWKIKYKMDMLRDIYANEIIQELKLIPVNFKKPLKWKILKGINLKKRHETEIINKKMEDLLKDAYLNNRELNFRSGKHKGWNILSNIGKFRIIKTNPPIKSRGIPVNELTLFSDNERIINGTSLITEQDESITIGNACSPSSVFEHYREITTISTRSPSFLEQDGGNITKEYSLHDPQLKMKRDSANLTIKLVYI